MRKINKLYAIQLNTKLIERAWLHCMINIHKTSHSSFLTALAMMA